MDGTRNCRRGYYMTKHFPGGVWARGYNNRRARSVFLSPLGLGGGGAQPLHAAWPRRAYEGVPPLACAPQRPNPNEKSSSAEPFAVGSFGCGGPPLPGPEPERNGCRVSTRICLL